MRDILAEPCPWAISITTAICVPAGARALELLLGAEGGYVRDILAEELAKGLDAYWRLSADDALDAARARLVTVLGVSHRAAYSCCTQAFLSQVQDAVSLPRHPVACIDSEKLIRAVP